jgi:hypothetical protein
MNLGGPLVCNILTDISLLLQDVLNDNAHESKYRSTTHRKLLFETMKGKDKLGDLDVDETILNSVPLRE